jgi:predicted kinase
MNPNDNEKPKSNFISGIRTTLERLFLRRTHPPDKPYVTQPDQNNSNTAFEFDGDFSETETDVQHLHGTSIAFGTQKTIQIDDLGRAKGLTRKPSYIIGTGRRISNIEDIGGICRFCQTQAAQAFQEGKLTVEEAQLQSLFDLRSGFQCDICGIYTCSIHCRPIQTPQGLIDVCAACREEIKRQERRKKIIGLLLSPFTSAKESENQ